jgi:magnesium transporter
MAHDDDGGGNSNRSLSRALADPVRRAMHRMRGNGHPVEAPRTADYRSGVVDCALYVDGIRQPGEWNYAEALAAARRAADGFVWLGLKEPGAAELADIADIFDLHELAVEDAVKSHQRPKVERYGDMTFVTLRTARYCEHEELTETSEVVESGDVMMFIGTHFIITVRHGDAVQLGPIRADLDSKSELLTRGPWAVAYAVYDRVVDGLVEVAAAMEEDVAAVEDSVFARASEHSGRIQRIYQLKRELMEFKRVVIPLQRPVASLAGGQLTEIPKEIRKYFRDVNDHLARTAEQVLYFDDVLNSTLSARLAQVSVDQNNDMRKIAAWAGIAAVWTSIAGIEGMNFEFMPEKDWTYGYPVALLLMLGISLGLYRAFRRSGWL